MEMMTNVYNNIFYLFIFFFVKYPNAGVTWWLCCCSTVEPVAVGIIFAALVHRFSVHNQANMIVTTLDRGEASRVSHLPALNPAGNAQVHPQLVVMRRNDRLSGAITEVNQKEKKNNDKNNLVKNHG